MEKTQATSSEKIVRDPKSGRYVVVRGAGSLKGQLTLREGLDLTKPIASQALKGAKRPQRDHAGVKG
ncbi:MAG TPA: hypothetical protein VE053_08550 [Allosphingosinicella sp.]|nr:hypothetical protein [Allosphingosinicella sp.]